MRVGELRSAIAHAPADSVIVVLCPLDNSLLRLKSVAISTVSANHQVIYLTAIDEAPEL